MTGIGHTPLHFPVVLLRVGLNPSEHMAPDSSTAYCPVMVKIPPNLLGPDSLTAPPVSSYGGFTISAYVVSNAEKYRDTDTITDIPIPASKRLMNLAPGAVHSCSSVGGNPINIKTFYHAPIPHRGRLRVDEHTGPDMTLISIRFGSISTVRGCKAVDESGSWYILGICHGCLLHVLHKSLHVTKGRIHQRLTAI